MEDFIPVLGMFLGGTIGFALASMMSPGQTTGRESSSRGMLGRSRHEHQGSSPGMGRASDVEHDESTDLIASSKVEGTAVYNRNGEHLGEVYNFMVGKRSGRVAYAVMSLGGFLGIGRRYHALPWNVLTYDTKRGGYVIDADRDILMAAPHYAEGEDPFARSDNMRRMKDYWSSVKLSR